MASISIVASWLRASSGCDRPPIHPVVKYTSLPAPGFLVGLVGLFGLGGLIGAAAACGPLPARAPSPIGVQLPGQILVRSKGRIVAVPLEDYTLGSILSEVSPIGESPATAARVFEVQAVVARSYAVAELGRHRSEGFDLCDSTHCQLYDPTRIRSSAFADLARAAVRATAGRVMTYRGRVAETFFHADCGGSTAAADDVWGGDPIPYLVAAPDVIAPAKHRAWTSTISVADLTRALDADPQATVGRRVDSLDVRTRDASGRAKEIVIRGDTPLVLTGDEFRAVINRALGDRTLDSAKFTVVRDGSRYTFTGTGLGHGVGLCQLGAAARARRGDTLEAILGEYFPGAVLSR
jgi:stage II sporulation protein D